MKIMQLIPIILAGGSGERLFPLSTKVPKQYIKLPNQKYTLLQLTLIRALAIDTDINTVITVTAKIYYEETLHQYQTVLANLSKNIKLDFIFEPFQRNTGPAICLAILYIENEYGVNIKTIVLPADHLMADSANEIIKQGTEIDNNYLVTIGIKPTFPDKEFGYIDINHNKYIDSANIVNGFIEKPTEELAKTCIKNGFLWNSGIFIGTVSTWKNEFEKYCGLLVEKSCFSNICKYGNIKQAVINENFAGLAISIDKAVFEHSKHVAVMKYEGVWSDIGSWQSLKLQLISIGTCFVTSNVSIINCNTSIIWNVSDKRLSIQNINNMLVINTDKIYYFSSPIQ